MNNESLQLSVNRNYLGCNMAWTKEQTLKFQMDNNEALKEINSTLKGLTWKPIIGIFAPGQNGDAMVVSSVLKYKDELFSNKEIVWFCNYPVADFLRFSKEINEVRPWPWAGNGLPENTPDFYPLLCNNDNRLNKELAKEYELTKDLEDGYFPCPWMIFIDKRRGMEYSNCSKKIFGVPVGYEWHPVINFSDIEKTMATEFIDNFFFIRKIIAIETFAGSGHSLLSDVQVRSAMEICNDVLGECNFIFVSHKYLNGQEEFPAEFKDKENIYFAKDFTVRQTSLIANKCDLLLSVSSGITVASSAWEFKNNPVPILQFCGSEICSTRAISLGRFELVTHDLRNLDVAVAEYEEKLYSLLNEIK